MEFTHFVEVGFYSLTSIIALYIANSIKEMRISIDELNRVFSSEIQKIANMKDSINRVEMHMDRYNERLIVLEKNCNYCKLTKGV